MAVGAAGTPEPGGGSTAGDSKPGVSHTEDQRFSTVEMAALGGVLGALLVLTLIALLILVHKHYGHRFKCCSGKAQVRPRGPWGSRQDRDRGRERQGQRKTRRQGCAGEDRATERWRGGQRKTEKGQEREARRHGVQTP